MGFKGRSPSPEPQPKHIWSSSPRPARSPIHSPRPTTACQHTWFAGVKLHSGLLALGAPGSQGFTKVVHVWTTASGA
ncbi:hypothetical protein OEZ86_001893 [Tetradesmus obliquus]|nr:hypothetical protein OEZ86_001893 [Tetradesmus obliquus]